jgi:hypothetical protein
MAPMLSFLVVVAQITAAAAPADPTYSTPALRHLVERAAVENHEPPASLRAYRSRVESELSLLVRDTLGREEAAEIEQFAANARWIRNDRYDLRIVGYRSQNIGVPYSALSFVRAWTVPTLYGERLTLGAYFNPSGGRDTLIAVHPFSSDRDRYYRFSGGDTVTTLRAGQRSIPVVRIHVQPSIPDSTRLAAFDGEIDLDADRAQIIRMRGQFVVLGGRPSRGARIIERLGVVAAAYVEFVNAEIDGSFWLPTFQRTEFQTSLPFLGQNRPVFRLVSTISQITVDTAPDARNDSSRAVHVSVTWAPRDSVDGYVSWGRDIGSLTSSVHANDFDDIAPDAWRATGKPRVDLFPTSVSRMLRFNRVEGAFTGVAPMIDFRSAAPGFTASAFAGWAWAEQTARGGGYVSYRRPAIILGARAERSLASTNDFVPPLSDDPGFGALFGSIDNADYVDRRTAALAATRVIGSVKTALATLEVGVDNDRPERTHVARGLFSSGTSFRENRGVYRGTSARVGAELEIHPSVSGEFVEPGLGARARVDLANGDLDWTRAELRVSARQYVGPLSIVAEANGGAVFGDRPPPQRLFEMGGDESLPGYDYKQFVGDRAALFGTSLSYRLGLMKRPIRVWHDLLLPGPAPAVAFSIQGGWSGLSSTGARGAAVALTAGTTLPPPEPTKSIRATAGVGLTFFSDLLHVGVARPVDRAAPLRFVAGFGPIF